MDANQAREMGLKYNSFALATAVDNRLPRIVQGGDECVGRVFHWSGDEWRVVDLETLECRIIRRLAVVTLESSDPYDLPDAHLDNGLNQVALGIDLDRGRGEWVVDAADLSSLRDTYAGNLVVLWSQEAA